MANQFASLDGNELSQLLNSFLKASKDKRGSDMDGDRAKEGYRMMAGDLQGQKFGNYAYTEEQPVYDNVILPAWKAFAPSHGGSKPPCPMVSANMKSKEALAAAFQELFRYRVETFNYTEVTTLCGMDAFFLPAGVGYARHRWDDTRGLARTDRFDPTSVHWDAKANHFSKATHVIERHCIPRYEFAKKFGKKIAQEVDAEGDSVPWPKKVQESDFKSPLDQIEYFLCWSKVDGYKRVYAFTKNADDEILNEDGGEPGEPWPITLADEDWHLTPLVFTPIPGKTAGVSSYWANRSQLIGYQQLNATVFFASLKSGKSIVFYPDALAGPMNAVNETGRVVTPVPYNSIDVPGKLSDMLEKWELPKISDELLRSREEAFQKWRAGINVNAAQMIDAKDLQTATEAQTLKDAASNMLADDQEKVEQFTTDIFRKEATIDAGRKPKRSIVCVKTAVPMDEPEGEFEDDPKGESSEKDEGETYLYDVPFEDAVLLEKGPASVAAAKMLGQARETMGRKAMMDAAMKGAPTEQLDQVQQQAESQVQETPELAIRRKYNVPVDATCKIEVPGIDQIVGEELVDGWEEGLTPREVQTALGISTEPGSSSATGRMQAVNEVLMLFNALTPVLLQLGQYETIAELVNAAIKKSEIAALDNVRVTLEQIQAFQQQQQQQAMQEAAAKGQPQGPVPEDPNVMAKAESEVQKAQIGHETQKEKTVQQQLKLEGDAARERTRSMSQLQMGGMVP